MAEEKLVEIFISLEVLQEISRVLECERILRFLKRSRTEPSSVMATVLRLSSIVDVAAAIHEIEDDPSDNQILACAKQANVQFIVSGDRHLLRLGNYDGTGILTASKFLEMFRNILKT